MRFHPFRSALCLILLAGLAAPLAAQSRSTAKGISPAEFGEPFPPGKFGNFNVQAGGAETIDLGTVIGKKPVILFYWIAGNPRADEMFRVLQDLAAEYGEERIGLYGVAIERVGREADVIQAKLRELGIRVPVLDDEEFVLGQRLRVQSVPNITILDKQGILRLSNGAALSQDLEYKMTVETAIRRAAEKGSVGTYGYLARYYPVTELVGKKCPDFTAQILTTDVEQSWHSMLGANKLNLLVFWSIDCPHCRRMLPEINDWLKEGQAGINVVTAAKVDNETHRFKTREFCEQNGFVFPTLADPEAEIAREFLITSTPTILVIGPDGIVDSVMLSSVQDFRKAIEERKRALLDQPG